MDYFKKELILWLSVVLAGTVILCYGIAAMSRNSSELNKIEYVCYEHGGHMVNVPNAHYLTCVDQTR